MLLEVCKCVKFQDQGICATVVLENVQLKATLKTLSKRGHKCVESYSDILAQHCSSLRE